MPNDSVASNTVQVIFRVSLLLDAIAVRSPMTLVDLTSETGLPKTTVHRLLRSMESVRMVVRDGRGFKLGSRIVQWHTPPNQHRQLQFICPPILDRVAKESGETASIFLGLYDRRVCFAVEEGPQEVRHVLKRDQIFPLGVGSAGKLLISTLSPLERKYALEATLQRFSGLTIPYHSDEELDQISRVGFATSMEERESGLASLSVLIPLIPRVCLSISGPAHRFDSLVYRRLLAIAKAAVEEIEAELQGVPMEEEICH